MSLADPAVADAAALVVAGLTVTLLDDRSGTSAADVLLAARADDGTVPTAHEFATYTAAVDLLSLVVAHASTTMAVDVHEVVGRIGRLVAAHTVRPAS